MRFSHCELLTFYLSCGPWMPMFMVTVSFVTVSVGPQRLASQYTLALETVKLLGSVGQYIDSRSTLKY